MDSTYACAVAIVRRIFEREIRYVQEKYGKAEPREEAAAIREGRPSSTEPGQDDSRPREASLT
jgi:hypothetical protein